MLIWTSVVADAPSDADIAVAVARREALEVRPLLDFAPLRLALGLPVFDEPVPAAAQVTPAAAPTRTRKRSAATRAAAKTKQAATATKTARPKTARPKATSSKPTAGGIAA
jgi:hypothetical protein